jgi:uroporphyrinogen III methyltransferase/synthase
MSAPLVVVTRQADAAGSLVEAIEVRGMRAWHVPATMTVPPADVAPLDAAIEALGDADWLVVTSARAVESLRARDSWQQAWTRATSRVRVAAVGPATSRALQAAGIDVHLQPAGGTAADLLQALRHGAGPLDGRRLVWPHADIADTSWGTALEQAGAEVIAPVAYCTVDVQADTLAPLRRAVDEGSVDAVTFCSPSSARSLARAFEDRTLHALADRAVVAAIGKTTAAALEGLGARPDVVSSVPEPAALADQLARHLAVSRGGTR